MRLWVFVSSLFVQACLVAAQNRCVQKLLLLHSCGRVINFGHRFLSVLGNVSFSSPEQKELDSDCLVISNKGLVELELSLKGVYYKPGFGTLRFALVLLSDPTQDILHTFQVLWNFYIVNAVVLVGEASMYTYYPLSEGQCRVIVPKYLGHCSSDPISLQGAPRNFPNCTLRVVANAIMPFITDKRDGGLEIQLLNVIVEHLKFELQLSGFDYVFRGDKKPDGSYAWDFQNLLEHKLDLIIGALVVVYNAEGHFQITHPHMVAGNALYAPLATRRAPWKNLVLIYNYSVWLATCASFVIVTVCFSIFAKEIHALLMYSVLLASAPWQPQEFKLRLVFLSWCIVAMIIGSVYQGLFTSYLFTPAYDKQVTTLEEGIKAGLNFGGFLPIRRVFYSDTNRTLRYIYDNYISCSRDGPECYNRVVFDKDFVLSRVDRLMSYHMQLNKTHRAFMLEPMSRFFFCTFLSKRSPFYDRVDKTIFKLIESGHILKWDHFANFPIYPPEVKSEEPITLKHLLFIFGSYGCGILTSALTFFLELLKYRDIF